MAQRILVDNLIEEIRQQLDEDNTVAVSDTADILPALNRAQNFALDILARSYPSALLSNTAITAVPGQDSYDIPEDALEQRLLKVEVNQTGTFIELLAISHLDIGLYETAGARVATPYYYCIVGSQFKVYPAPSGAYNFRVWYLKDAMPLVPSQGRINILNTVLNYLIVDEPGEDLSAVSDNLASFASIIDGATGARKGTLQIQSISGNKITFKTVPTRSTVYDLEIDADLGDLSTGLSAAVDDYLCLSTGTCVPFMKKPLSNFLINFSVNELRRKLGFETPEDKILLEEFEKQVSRTWVQRPNSMRVRKRSAAWAIPIRKATTG